MEDDKRKFKDQYDLTMCFLYGAIGLKEYELAQKSLNNKEAQAVILIEIQKREKEQLEKMRKLFLKKEQNESISRD